MSEAGGRSGVATHLRIPIEEYDYRIRTFVPFYDEMLEAVASAVDTLAGEEPRIVDLGTGTGALAAACARVRPGGHITGIDGDSAMLDIARTRLASVANIELRAGDFLTTSLPDADVIVASISLHHVGDADTKRRLYAACRRALHAGGTMIIADCFPPSNPRLAAAGMAAWRRHLESTYSKADATAHLDGWAAEDTYFPLEHETSWITQAGFRVEVAFRRYLFAVLICNAG
jgi:tRNA (cmo5U34)-methyltransferase